MITSETLLSRISRVHTLKFIFRFMYGRGATLVGLADLEEALFCKHKKSIEDLCIMASMIHHNHAGDSNG